MSAATTGNKRESTRKRKSSSSMSKDVREKRQNIIDNKSTGEMTHRPTEEIMSVPPPAYAITRGPAVNQGTQWEDPSLTDYHRDEGVTVCKQTHESEVTSISRPIQCDVVEEEGVAAKLIKSDSDAKLYTGISQYVFLRLVANCKPFANQSFRMHLPDQILTTLMKLKLKLLTADLARRFDASSSLINRIISYWIDVLAIHLSDLIVWLPRTQIKATMPNCFKLRYPNTTCIIDCAETIMQKANNLKSRGESFSTYKAHNTAKYLVAIAPCGLIMFISQAYDERASDKFIVEDSGVLKRLLPGDEVMADRGFTITDLLPLQVKLNIPAFTKGGKLLNEEKVTDTRRLANVRMHVDRAFRRLKVFNILNETACFNDYKF